MTNSLLEALRKETNVAYTANGAISNASTLSDVLDYFASAPARRSMDNTQLFSNAYAEDKVRALQAAFYVRDARGGQGERDTFTQALRWLYNNDRKVFDAVIELVPVYGRWDEVLEFVDSAVVVRMVVDQLLEDNVAKNPSLLGKWMPSINTTGKGAIAKAGRKLGRKWARVLGLTELQYRVMLAALRKKIGIVERLMSAKAFDQINYEHVPSRAAMLYRKAFSKQDGTRYGEYIAAVNNGEKKINADVLYPYELTTKYTGYTGYNGAQIDQTVEALWKNLPNYCKTRRNALVIADVSGSMFSAAFYGSTSKIAPIDISVSLAIYIAERNEGAFHNYFMTFSTRPELEKLRGNSLRDKCVQLNKSNWAGSTDVQAAFDLILTTAVMNHVPQSEMPEVLFIISDMQFNGTVTGLTNLEEMRLRYSKAGYELPKIVFWNVNAARGKDQPVTYDQRGVYLVGGASPSIFEAAINSGALTPMEMMLEVLDKPRYAPIAEAVRDVI